MRTLVPQGDRRPEAARGAFPTKLCSKKRLRQYQTEKIISILDHA